MDKIMNIPAFSVLALVTLANGATAQSMPRATLPLLDGDKNGQVSSEEFVQQMDAIFGAMDTNKNGRVEFVEVEGFMEPEQFDPADTNKDGALSKKEYDTQIRKDFEAADKDGDGSLG